MRRELLLERIDKLKATMPWYILEYYQSKLAVPYSNISKNMIAFLTGC